MGMSKKKEKSAQLNFLWGKSDVMTAIQQFYIPKNFYTPSPQKRTNFISGYAPGLIVSTGWLIYIQWRENLWHWLGRQCILPIQFFSGHSCISFFFFRMCVFS